jgi:hypothetical protein
MNTLKVPKSNIDTIRSELRKDLCSTDELTPIDISEARRVMGPSADHMSDTEVQDMIYNLTAIARSFVRAAQKHEIFMVH